MTTISEAEPERMRLFLWLPSIAGPRVSRLVFLGLALAIAGGMIYVHRAAALTFPAPWGDEAYFLWQARAFERWNSFIAPELDPTRPLFLLPFVYGATLGLVFKVFGYSFEVARHVSLAFVLVGFTLLAVMVRRQTAAIAVLALVGAFMLNPHFVAMANNARMEAYLFAVVCGALLLMQRGRIWMSVALLSVTPMIHPNGVFFLGPAAGYALWSGELRRVRPGKGVLAMFAASALVWLANGVYALAYWDGFMHETALRFGETLEKHGGLAQFEGWHAVGFALIVGTAMLARRRPGIAPLPVFALGAWLCGRVRLEQWYEVFGDFAYLLVSLAVVELAADAASTKWPAWSRLRSVLAGAVAVGLLAVHYRNGRIDGPINYLSELEVNDMRIAPPGAYFRAEDHQAIAQLLDTFEPGCAVSVEVYPWGDALLFADLDGGRVRFQLPYFDPMFQPEERWGWGYHPTPAPLPDLYLVRVSRYQPRWLKPRDERFLKRALTNSGVESPTVFHSRDTTEIWYAIRPVRAGQPAARDCRPLVGGATHG